MSNYTFIITNFKLFVYTLLTVLTVSLQSCSPNTQEECIRECSTTISLLIAELKEVNSREDLLKKKGVLRKYFDQIAHMMVLAKTTEDEGLNDAGPPSWNQELLIEMMRIYEIDGAKELMENYQKNALRSLAEKNINP